jgi:hypothetical protein
MTQLETTQLGTLEEPVPIPSLPFAQTIDVADRTTRPHEPSECLPTATAVWYRLTPWRAGSLVLDLTGSTPLDPVVRLYRRPDGSSTSLHFLGCSSPVWNAQLSLEVPVAEGDALLAQVGTSDSRDGRLVVRVELRGARGVDAAARVRNVSG